VSHSLDEILEVEQQLQHAMVKNDVPALERLLHDELVFIDITGNVQGKRSDIASHASGAVHQTEVEFVEAPVTHLHGETAVVAVKTHVKGVFNGAPAEALCRYLRVWLFQDERWQIIAGEVRIISS
jgi:ketosteroid isomerase-like protein